MAFFGERMLEESYKPGAPSVDRLRDMNKQEYLLLNDFPFFLDDITRGAAFLGFPLERCFRQVRGDRHVVR